MAEDMPIGSGLATKGWNFDGFQQGNDTFSLATEASKNALVSMLNAEIYGKRSVRPRRGGEALGSALGSAPIDGLFQYREGVINDIMAICAGQLKKFDINNLVWNNVSGGTFSTGARTRAVKMRGALYFGNAIDDFTKYTEGGGIQTFTAVAAPSGGAVSPQGTPGTSAYSYQLTTVTAKGESLPSTAFTTSTGNAELDQTDFNRVTFNRSSDALILGYNLYGRATTGNGRTLMKFIPQPASGSTVTFDDDGTITPTIWLPPDGDSTDGIKARFWEQLKGSLVGGGVIGQEHRIFYSGTGDKYESFSPAHNGGWADVRPGDNDIGVNGLAPFESKIIVPKQKSVHQFYFDTQSGDAVIQELISYVGCGAIGSIVVMENDIALIDAERKLRIFGYEPNFQASIRTTSLSEGRTQSLYDEIDPAKIQNCEAVYHKGRYILAATGRGSEVNDRIFVYDRRYLAFIGKWTGKNAHVRCWLVYDGIDGQNRLFAGSSDDDGVVFEFDVEDKLTDHDGSPVVTNLRFRNEDLGNSGQQKIWKWSDFRLYRIQGTVRLKTVMDGVQTIDERDFTSQVRVGWGIVRWGTQLWGTTTGVAASASDLDQTRRKEIYELGNSLQHEISKSDARTDFILVSMRGEAFLLPTEVFDSNKYI